MLKIPTRSLVQLIGCLCVAAAIGMLMVFPAYRSLDEKDLAAATIRRDIASQKVLAPLFKEMLEKAKLKDTGELASVKRAPWPRDRAGGLQTRFEEVGRTFGLEVDVRLPDAAELIKKTTHLKIDVVARGAFSDFRPFFLSIYRMPFVDHVERIQILAGDGREEMRLKLWIAQN